MPDQISGQNPAGNANNQSSASAPASTVPKQQSEVGNPSNQYSDQAISETNELRKELHWLEKANFAGQIILAVVGIFALLVYRGQLRVMQSTLDEMKRSGEGSTAQANRVIDNMNWLANEMHNSVNEAHQSIESSQRQSEASIQAIQEQNRPWIKIMDVKPRNGDWGFALFFGETPPRNGIGFQAFFAGKLVIKNVGHSVANNVAVGYKLVFQKPGSFLADDILKEQKRFCQSFLKGATDPFDYKVLVFPDETYTTDVGDGTVIQPSDVRFGDSRRQYIRAAIEGCVNYSYKFSTKTYQSGFVYFIDPPEEGRETFEVGQNTPMEKIRLARFGKVDYAK